MWRGQPRTHASTLPEHLLARAAVYDPLSNAAQDKKIEQHREATLMCAVRLT